MDSTSSATEKPVSASGDFYVDNQCCTSCGVPQVAAPDLIGWIEEKYPHCYWKAQPKTQNELQQAFAIFDGQELGCHRYAGRDPVIQARIGRENCDHPIVTIKQRIAIQNAVPRFETVEDEGFIRKLFSKLMRKR